MTEQGQDRPKTTDTAQALQRVLSFLQFESADCLSARLMAALAVLPLTLLLLASGIGTEWLTRGGQIPAYQNQSPSIQSRLIDSDNYKIWVEKQIEALAPDRSPWNPSEDLGIAGLTVTALAWERNTALFWTAMNWLVPFASQGDPKNLSVPPLLISLGALCVGLLITWIILHTLSELSASRAASGVVTRLRLAIYHHAVRLGDPELAGLDAKGLFTPQLAQLEEVLRRMLGTKTRCITGVCSFGVLALIIDRWLALAGLATLGLAWAIAMLVRENTRARASFYENQSRQSLKLARDSVSQTRLTRALCMEVPQHLKVEEWLDSAEASHISSRRTLSLGWLMVALAITILCSGWLFLSTCEVHARAIEAGLAGVQAAAMGGMLIWIRGLGRIRSQGNESSAAAHEIFEYLDKRAMVIPTSEQEKTGPLAEAFELDSVTVSQGEQILLDHVSLVIRAGEKMALVGLDSAQKEALLLLPGRLVSPLTGDLRWDRLNIRLAEPTSLRKQIGVVSGQGQLFHGTILENITAGDCAITEAQAEEAASVARLDGHVRALAHGYKTIVGPHGKVLPEVLQFQITLARAMLRNPSLLLVVEPRIETGSDSSDILDDALSRALAGKTAFVCPTRLSTLSLCDQIAVIDRGKVNAVGTHKPLSEDNALYRHMLRTGF